MRNWILLCVGLTLIVLTLGGVFMLSTRSFPRETAISSLGGEGLVAPPVPVEPADGAYLSTDEVHLEWQWIGSLEAGSWFRVRIWHEEGDHMVDLWAQVPEAWVDLSDYPDGRYTWSVVAIRGQPPKQVENLSPKSQERSFVLER